MPMHARWRAGLLFLGLFFLTGCGLQQLRGVDPSAVPTALASTGAQQVAVRQYIQDVATGQYAAAWKMLTPERQRRQSVDRFADLWRGRGQVLWGTGDLFLWPAAIDEVRARFWVQHANGGGIETFAFHLDPVAGEWRIADEQEFRLQADTNPRALTASPSDFARALVRNVYGPIYLPTFRMLDDEPYEGGRIVVFRFLDPLIGPKEEGPHPTAMLLYLRPENGGWGMYGGGAIGTLAEPVLGAVVCAWTWIHLAGWEPRNLPRTAAFYCTVGDPRVAAVEIKRVDGGVQRARVNGRQAVVFPYVWDSPTKLWPAQLPTSIRLFDTNGQPLDLSTCCTVAQVQQSRLATQTAP
ncbi:MAG: hypothetical protein ACRDIY_08425 [Chloroflexota bacterium]